MYLKVGMREEEMYEKLQWAGEWRYMYIRLTRADGRKKSALVRCSLLYKRTR
jgi:hypothetical protein